MLNTKTTILKQFKTLDRAIIDTSSVIYLSKTDLLKATAKTLHLITVAGVVNETGDDVLFKHIEIVDVFSNVDARTDTDQCVVNMAVHLKIPVISEDKKVLMNAKAAGLAYYNSLMILNFLLYKGVIQKDSYGKPLHRLKQSAHYSAEVYRLGKMVYEWIRVAHQL